MRIRSECALALVLLVVLGVTVTTQTPPPKKTFYKEWKMDDLLPSLKDLGVGHDWALDEGIGMCGKAGQSVPAGVGQPTLLMEGLTVGGTAT